MNVCVLAMIALHTLDGQVVHVNPCEIVSIRQPTTNLLSHDIQCTLQTVDAKLINVVDSCDEVLRLIGRSDK